MPTASGHTSVIHAKEVIGTSVKNAAGEKIGQVEDIVLGKLTKADGVGVYRTKVQDHYRQH